VKARFYTPANRKWWTLGAVAFGLFMIMLDNTIVNVALPSIQKSLGMTVSELEWVVAGYALTFGALMLTGGKLADLYGRRLVFVLGLIVFTASSLACGLAGSAGMLIGSRVAQGVGAAMMNPATLSIITVTFPRRERGTAIGIWAGVSALALAIGPLVGGLLTEHANWNWIFFINVPVGILGIAAAFLFIDESRDTSREQRPDLPGLLSSAIGLFALIYALIEANTYGWTSTRILIAFAVAAVSLSVFVLLELHQRLPMLDLRLFRNRAFAGANTVTGFLSLAMFGVFFYVSLYVQQVLGYSPIQAGASFLPWTILIMVVAPLTGKLAERVGARTLVSAGLVILAGSLFWFSRLGVHESFWSLLPGMILGGLGMASSMPTTTTVAMHSVSADKAGVGSAVLNSARQVGGSLGIALMGAIVASGVKSSLAAGDPRPVAFTHGFHHGLEVAGIIVLVGALIAFVTLHHQQAHKEPQAAEHFAEAA
jgi:EmrB/QacA subfamily drug resistance transporter